ncbi:MAG: porin [Prevotella sp.]|nr:porin [Prevotella sp.]
MKKLLTIACLAFALTANAQVSKWYDNIKLSGYGMLQFQASDKKWAEDNTFNLRLMRLIVDGKISDFDWRVQMQGTSNAGPGNPTMQLVDLYTEWNRYKAFRVKVGQFKRAFTFENPTHPITQGWYSYAMVINNLVGFGDRTGEKSSGGRDIGLQVQGDLLQLASGRSLLHYQVGVYNGEGINQKDKDNRKDIIGGLWLMPFDGVRIGAFGWTGSRAGVGDKNRYALSAEYDKNEFTFRTEYVHSQGNGADLAMGDKADGIYAFGIVPVVKSKLHAKARYNLYRQSKEWATSKTMYEVGFNYFFTKNLQLNVEYARVNERAGHHNYNFGDVELDFRF